MILLKPHVFGNLNVRFEMMGVSKKLKEGKLENICKRKK